MAHKPRENLFGLLTSAPNRVDVIAEAGVNHGGKKERALALVRAAKWAGADAVKFQTFGADRLASTQPAALAHSKDQANLQELFKKLELPLDTFRALHKEAERVGIEFLSTPFDEESAGFFDHSVGRLGSLVATSLGAQVIERHFMIETRGETPDQVVSLDAKALKIYIEDLRRIGTLLGERGKFATEAESRNKTASRRAL